MLSKHVYKLLSKATTCKLDNIKLNKAEYNSSTHEFEHIIIFMQPYAYNFLLSICKRWYGHNF